MVQNEKVSNDRGLNWIGPNFHGTIFSRFLQKFPLQNQNTELLINNHLSILINLFSLFFNELYLTREIYFFKDCRFTRGHIGQSVLKLVELMVFRKEAEVVKSLQMVKCRSRKITIPSEFLKLNWHGDFSHNHLLTLNLSGTVKITIHVQIFWKKFQVDVIVPG